MHFAGAVKPHFDYKHIRENTGSIALNIVNRFVAL
jgi:hypothetical protein